MALIRVSFLCFFALFGCERVVEVPSDSDSSISDTDTTERFSLLSSNGAQSCLLLVDGTVECWSRDEDGQPAHRISGRDFTHLDVGPFVVCLVKAEGAVSCEGSDIWNVLDVPSGSFTRVSSGQSHSCAITSEGAISCWGDGTPEQSFDESTTFVELSSGDHHTCSIAVDGTLHCIGDPAGESDSLFRTISSREFHSCGVTFQGEIECVGEHSTWMGAMEGSGGGWVDVDVGLTHACALADDGQVRCWGNPGGERLDPPSDAFKMVSAASSYSCGVTVDEDVVCWGTDVEPPL